MSRLPFASLALALGCCLCVNHKATAQGVSTSSVLSVSESRATLQREPQRLRSLLQEVQGGRVALVSSDAAQLFGFKTVAARERTRERPGQRFGHGVVALRFGASPLLWSAQGQSAEAKDDGMPGVRSVFYTLPDTEDVLLSDIGKSGIALLRVDDLGAPFVEEKPLYAAALRRYGRGWVVFAPRHIEERADGAQFKANIQAFASAAAQGQWQAMPASLLSLADPHPNWKRLRRALATGSAPASEPPEQARPDETRLDEGQAPQKPDASGQEPQGTERASLSNDEAFVPVSQEEAQAIDAVWKTAQDAQEGKEEEEARVQKRVRPVPNAAQDEEAQQRARAVLALLRARLRWLHPEALAPDDKVQALEAPLLFQGDNPAPEEGGNPALEVLAKPEEGSNPARQALARLHEGSAYASFARFWNGVLALRPCDLSLPDEADSSQVRLRAFSFVRQAREANRWWQNASCPLADGSTSAKEVAKARASLGAIAKAHKDDPPLLATWTSGDTLCSLLLSPMHAVSAAFPPDPHRWGMPLADVSRTVYGHLLIPWNDPRALPIGAVEHPLEYPPSNQFCSQMMWRCSFWWAQDLPRSLGFSPVPLHFVLKPVEVVETPESVSHLKQNTRSEDWWQFIQQARLQGNTLITVDAPFHPPVPTPELFRLQRQSSGDKGDDQQGMMWMYDGFYGGIQHMNADTLPSRVARMASWQEVVRWCDGTPRTKDNQPGWLSQGLQDVFSLQTANFLDNNQNSSDNVFMSNFYSRLNQPASWLATMVRGMADEARTQSAAVLPLDQPSSIYKRVPFGGPPLEDKESTQQVLLLYTRFGAGVVGELLQRLGAGESTDEALQHTIGMNQNAFFELWRQSTPPAEDK